MPQSQSKRSQARQSFLPQTVACPSKTHMAASMRGRPTNGNIKVALDAEPSLKLTAATVNGRVRCEVPGFVASVNKRQKIEGTIGAGETELIAETKNGSIVVQ